MSKILRTNADEWSYAEVLKGDMRPNTPFMRFWAAINEERTIGGLPEMLFGEAAPAFSKLARH